MIPRVIGTLFKDANPTVGFKVSYMEIYNEKGFDLLADQGICDTGGIAQMLSDSESGGSKRRLSVCEAKDTGEMVVRGLCEHPVWDAQQCREADHYNSGAGSSGSIGATLRW